MDEGRNGMRDASWSKRAASLLINEIEMSATKVNWEDRTQHILKVTTQTSKGRGDMKNVIA